jgi:hypothetical protein
MIIKEFTARSVAENLAVNAMRYAEENNLTPVQIQSSVLPQNIYHDGRLCNSVRVLTVLYKEKGDQP